MRKRELVLDTKTIAMQAHKREGGDLGLGAKKGMQRVLQKNEQKVHLHQDR